jgi:hypothetical protein
MNLATVAHFSGFFKRAAVPGLDRTHQVAGEIEYEVEYRDEERDDKRQELEQEVQYDVEKI